MDDAGGCDVTARTFYRSPAFDSFGEFLDWSERLGQRAPTVYAGPDQSFRGSVEVDGDRNGDAERDYDDEDCGKPASHRAGH